MIGLVISSKDIEIQGICVKLGCVSIVTKISVEDQIQNQDTGLFLPVVP